LVRGEQSKDPSSIGKLRPPAQDATDKLRSIRAETIEQIGQDSFCSISETDLGDHKETNRSECMNNSIQNGAKIDTKSAENQTNLEI